MKKTSLLCCIMVLGILAGCESPAQKDIKENWKKAYIEQVETSYNENPEYMFSLVYIDDDEIPELVVDFEGNYLSVYTYKNDKMMCSWDKATYGVGGCVEYEYEPKENLIGCFSQNGPSDFGYSYFSIAKDKVILPSYTLSAKCLDENGQIIDDTGAVEDWHYFYTPGDGEGCEISEAEFNEKNVELSDKLKGEYTTESIISQINNPKNKEDNIYQEYFEVIKSQLEKDNKKLAIQTIYLNDDDIPELVIFNDDVQTNAVSIYTFQNNKAVEIKQDNGFLGNYGSLVYHEKQSLVEGYSESENSSSLHGNTNYYSWNASDNSIILIHSSSFTSTLSDDAGMTVYYIDNEQVDEQTFEELENKYKNQNQKILTYEDAQHISSEDEIKAFLNLNL